MAEQKDHLKIVGKARNLKFSAGYVKNWDTIPMLAPSGSVVNVAIKGIMRNFVHTLVAKNRTKIINRTSEDIQAYDYMDSFLSRIWPTKSASFLIVVLAHRL